MVFQHFGLLAHRTRDRERRLRPGDPGRREGRAARRAPSEMLEPRRARGRREPVPRPALGRHAAARRPRARVRRRPQADALRRALQRARPADPPRHAGRGHAACRTRPARRCSSSRTTCPRRCGSATGSRSCATARSCSSARRRSSSARPPTTTSRTSCATSRAPTCSRCAGSCASRDPARRTRGPSSTWRTTVKDAVPVVAANDSPVRAVEGGRVVGVVDRVAVLEAMAGRAARTRVAVASGGSPRPALAGAVVAVAEPAGAGRRVVVLMMLVAFACCARRVPVAAVARLVGAAGRARRLPGLAARAAHGRRPELHLRDPRRLPRVRRVARHRVQRRAAVDDLARHVAAGGADRAALRRLARGADRPRRVRLVRADGAVGGEHPDARADVRRGAALARDRHAARRARRAQRRACTARSRRRSTRCRSCPRSRT